MSSFHRYRPTRGLARFLFIFRRANGCNRLFIPHPYPTRPQERDGILSCFAHVTFSFKYNLVVEQENRDMKILLYIVIANILFITYICDIPLNDHDVTHKNVVTCVFNDK